MLFNNNGMGMEYKKNKLIIDISLENATLLRYNLPELNIHSN